MNRWIETLSMLLCMILLPAPRTLAASAAPDTASAAAPPAGFLFREIEVKGTRHRYAVYVPPEYDAGRLWPCVVFLHGSGEYGADGEKQTRVGLPPAVLAHPDRWPCIVVMPQKPAEDEEWEKREGLVMAALEATRREYRVDPDRIMLTGLSQGGHGTWVLGARHPALWSCLAPVCGYARPRQVARRVAALPVWAFHGLRDDLVDPGDTRRMVEAIRGARRAQGLESEGPSGARMTLYPDVNHGCWDAAYGEADLPGWMLSQRRSPR